MNRNASSDPNLDRALAETARLRAAQRDALAATAPSVTTSMLAEVRGSTVNAARQWLHRHTTQGRLVTVVHDTTTLVPTFQLDDDASLDRDVTDSVKKMTCAGMDGWSVWTWWETPNGWLRDQAPADLMERKPDDVHEAVARLLDTSR